MDEEQRILRIGIDDRWEASEFAASLNALDRLYCLRLGLTLEMEELRELREFYFDAPFPIRHSLRYLRRLTKQSPALLYGDRGPLVSRGRVSPLALEQLEPEERLVVRRVLYGSPGIKDLAGIGEIIGHVKDLLIRLIEYWSTRRQRKLENERRELENKQLQVEVAKQFVGLAQELGYTKREMRQLVVAVVNEQRPLVQLIADGKIKSADSVDNDAS